MKGNRHIETAKVLTAVSGLLLHNVLLPNVVQAQIATDGSVGPAQVLTGPAFTVPQTLGTVSGGNLFHSFNTFNINAGQSVNFTTTSLLDNVISRVTGGSTSMINGQLKLTPALGSPDFYFINPAGVVFGAGASVNVPGAFHVGTADSITFPDGEFHADLGQGSTLSTASPEAFGFLGTTTASLNVVNGAQLSLNNGSTLSLAGGDIEISDASVSNIGGGDVRVVAVGSTASEIAFSGAVAATNGDLAVLGEGQVYTESFGAADAGNVTVMAGDIEINDQTGTATGTYIGTTAAAGTSGSGGVVDVTATGDLDIVNGGQINSNTYASGDSGTINVQADNLYVDNQGSGAWYTGILGAANTGSTGDVGDITVTASGQVSVVNGSEISANTYAAGDAGWVTISADDLLVDGQGSPFFTGIGSNANVGSSGTADGVILNIQDALAVFEGGEIMSSTWGAGDAGMVLISADSVTLDRFGSSIVTGIISNAESGSAGNAGLVYIDVAGDLEVVGGGEIGSNTFSTGDAGKVLVEADNILLDGEGSFHFTGIASNADAASTGDGGLVSVTANGLLLVLEGSEIASNTFGSGDAGMVLVEADDIYIEREGSGAFTGIASSATSSSTGDAGLVSVTAHDSLTVLDGGEIASNTFSSGDAGFVVVEAGDVYVDSLGSTAFTGISSAAELGSSGDAGGVFLTASGDVEVLDGAAIVSNTKSSGDAGTVTVKADDIYIDGFGNTFFTGIGTNAESGSSGDAGNVIVTASGDIALWDGGMIASNTNGSGDAGFVSVTAGDIFISAPSTGNLTGIATIADTSSSGDSGIVSVTANDIAIYNGGVIASDTRAAGDAGLVTVNADNIHIEGLGQFGDSSGITSSTRGTGDAGGVDVNVNQTLTIVNSGVIGSDNWFQGNAGTVNVSAADILIDRQGGIWTGISSDTIGTVGDAGSVSVSASNLLSIINNGAITSDTYGSGVAGNVNVVAGDINLASTGYISAQAYGGSSGQTGDVVVTASDTLSMSGDAMISIQNDATVFFPSLLVPTTLTVNAGDIRMNNADITANSTGNVNASNIVIRFSDTLRMESVSGITTVAADGNGGSITIRGGDLVYLGDSQISTSVTGLSGNGGNINFLAETLVMNTGFIQANTAADDASGGDVTVNVDNLFASFNSLFVGGRNAYSFQPGVPGFNVIQAVAPTGVSGNISISSPIVDLSGSMAGLTANVVDTGRLGRSPCQVNSGSSLAPSGRGGLPVSASGLARATDSPSVPETTLLALTALPDPAEQPADSAGCQFL